MIGSGRTKRVTSLVSYPTKGDVETYSTASLASALSGVYDSRYVLSSSFAAFTGSALTSLNAFSASINILSASLNIFTASINTFTASINIFSGAILGLSRAFSPLSATVAFWGATGSLSGASAFKVQQINSTTFNIGISSTNNLVTDTTVPFQIDSTGSAGYFGANKNGALGLLMGYDQGTYSGAAIRMVTSDNLTFVMNNSTVAGVLVSTGEWYLKQNTYVTGTLKVSSTIYGSLNGASAFRQQVIKGFIPANRLTGSYTVNTVSVTYGTASNSFVGSYFVAPFSGSLSAITGKVYNTISTGGTLTASIYKNNSPIASTFTYWTSTNMNANIYATFVPGAVTFVAGDYLYMNITGTNFSQAADGCEFALFVHM